MIPHATALRRLLSDYASLLVLRTAVIAYVYELLELVFILVFEVVYKKRGNKKNSQNGTRIQSLQFMVQLSMHDMFHHILSFRLATFQ